MSITEIPIGSAKVPVQFFKILPGGEFDVVTSWEYADPAIRAEHSRVDWRHMGENGYIREDHFDIIRRMIDLKKREIVDDDGLKNFIRAKGYDRVPEPVQSSPLSSITKEQLEMLIGMLANKTAVNNDAVNTEPEKQKTVKTRRPKAKKVENV